MEVITGPYYSREALMEEVGWDFYEQNKEKMLKYFMKRKHGYLGILYFMSEDFYCAYRNCELSLDMYSRCFGFVSDIESMGLETLSKYLKMFYCFDGFLEEDSEWLMSKKIVYEFDDRYEYWEYYRMIVLNGGEEMLTFISQEDVYEWYFKIIKSIDWVKFGEFHGDNKEGYGELMIEIGSKTEFFAEVPIFRMIYSGITCDMMKRFLYLHVYKSYGFDEYDSTGGVIYCIENLLMTYGHNLEIYNMLLTAVYDIFGTKEAYNMFKKVPYTIYEKRLV